MNNNLVQIVKDVTPASHEDLQRVLVNADTILNAYIELQKLLRKAPIFITAYLDDHDGDISMLDMLKHDIQDYMARVA